MRSKRLLPFGVFQRQPRDKTFQCLWIRMWLTARWCCRTTRTLHQQSSQSQHASEDKRRQFTLKNTPPSSGPLHLCALECWSKVESKVLRRQFILHRVHVQYVVSCLISQRHAGIKRVSVSEYGGPVVCLLLPVPAWCTKVWVPFSLFFCSDKKQLQQQRIDCSC